MCRIRQNIYTACGHGITLPDQIINCEKDNCVFSINHPATCQGEACRARCWPYKRYPEQYSPHINALCPNCVAAGGTR